MAFNAGSIEATLTLNRNPFTAGLAAARNQARGLSNQRFEVKITPRLDREALDRIRTTLNRTVGRMVVRPTLDRDAFQRIRNTIDRTVGRVTIRPNLDREAFDRIRNTINRTVGRVAVRLVLDRDDLLRIKAQIESLSATIRVRVDFDRDSLDALLNRLRGIRDETVRGENAFRSYGNSGGRAFRHMDGTVRVVLALLPLLLPMAGAAITGLLGLLGSLTAALVTVGLGVAAFGLVAVPVFKKIQDAVKAGQEEINKLPEGLKQAANAMKGMNTEYEKLVERTQSHVGLAMAAGFNAAAAALKTLDPLIISASRGFQLIGEMIVKYFGSPHWRNFVKLLADMMVPMMTRLFEIMAYGTRIVMNLTTAFMPMASWLLTSIGQGLKNMADSTEKLATDPRFHAWVETAKEALRRFWDFLVSVIKFIFEFSYAMAPLGSAIFNVLSMIFNGLSKMPPEWLNGIAMGLSGIFAALIFGASGPVALAIGTILGVSTALATLYGTNENVRTSVDNLANSLRTNFAPIWDTISKNFNEKILPAWERIVDVAKEHFEPALKAITDKANELWPPLQGLADTITGKLIPSIMEFVEHVTPFIATLFEFFGPVLLHIFEGAIRIVDGALQIISGLISGFVNLFQGDWAALGENLKTISEGFWTIIAGIFGMSLDDMKAVYKEWDRVIRNDWNNFWGGIITDQDGHQTEVKGSWNQFWTDVKANADKWEADLWGGWNKFWGDQFATANQWEAQIWGAWNQFWTDAFTNANTWEANLWGNWNKFWTDTFNTANTWEAQIWGAWNQFWTDLGVRFTSWWNQITGEWNAFWGGFAAITTTGVNAVGAEFRRIANLFRDPINWVINVVFNNGILNGWNTVMGWIGASALNVRPIPEIPAFASGGKVTGGVPGRDSVQAMLMPGEYVLSKRAIANMGGLGQVDQIHKAARQGSIAGLGRTGNDGLARQHLMRTQPYMDDGALNKYAYGGVQPHVAAAGAEIERVFGRMPGGIGGVGARANASDHPSGHALDFMTLSNVGLGNRVAGHLLANSARMLVKYLIWQQRINSGGGWSMMENRGSPTANHMDHVHASFKAAGSAGHAFSGGGAAGAVQVSLWEIFGQRVRDLFNGLLNFSGMPGLGSPIGDAVTQIPTKAVAAVIAAAQKKLEALFQEVVGGIATGVNVVRWTPTVLSALMRTGNNPLSVPVVLRRMAQESGGNPNAINNWDSNAARGTPSKGLMQVIDPTFNAYRDPGLPNNIWDPMANIVASMRYAKARYGTIEAAYNRAGGYATGGLLAPGQVGYNETGRPEQVLNPQQTEDFHQLVAMLRTLISSGALSGVSSSGDVYHVMLPSGATVKELASQIDYRKKISGKGRYTPR